MQRNLHLSYLYTAFTYFGIAGLWLMFLQQRGLSLVQIGLCESILQITSFLFQVPAGALADRFSYRTILITGRIAMIVHSLTMLLAPMHGFWWFAGSFVLYGWATSLQSGTVEAVLYESLADGQQTNRYPQVVSNMNATYKFVSMTGLIFAGFLIHDHAFLTYQLNLLGAVLALLAASAIHEPSRHTANGKPFSLGQLSRATVTSFRRFPKLGALMVFNAFFTVVGAGYYTYFQSVLSGHGFKGGRLSGILLIATILNVLSVQLTPRLQKRWSPLKLLSGLTGLLVLILIITGLNKITVLLAGYFLVNMLMAGLAPIMSSYYNAIIPSGERATLLSVSSMLYSIGTGLAFPLVGWGIEHFSFATTFAGIGVMGLILGLVVLGLILKRPAQV